MNTTLLIIFGIAIIVFIVFWFIRNVNKQAKELGIDARVREEQKK